MRTPLGRVLHFGSARGGTDQFWLSRVTAAANVPLVAGFVVVVLAAVGRPYEEVTAILGSPFVAVVMALLIVSAAIHMRLGMQVIIEDYVLGETLKIVLLVANTFFAIVIGVVALFAILKLAVGA